MHQQRQPVISGSYTANLLGNIRSHLAGLQGFDVMALELIQNADDAKAVEIVFNITDKGLIVTNSGQFTYCGDLNTRPCKLLETEDYGCDFHRIVDVGSGGKLAHSENIGRFGIGFVSTYQITDQPEIRSSGIKLLLHPESGQWFIEPIKNTPGTSFFLPWAIDPRARGRLELGVSHVTPAHIEQLIDDFKKVLRKSLLFLRNVRRAEVRHEGNLLLACRLERNADGSSLTVRFTPDGKTEEWHLLRADASEAAGNLYENYPGLKPLNRSTHISVGIRVKPDALDEGFLYAFLPTEQSTGLPFHLNADFFPESDRKALIFSGHQHQQAWNEMLIDAAATELARDPEGLLDILGSVRLWKLISRAFDLSNSEKYPACFTKFWEKIKETAQNSCIADDQDEIPRRPDEVFLPPTPLAPEQISVFKKLDANIVSENLRSYRTAMGQLGAPILTLERFVNLLDESSEIKSNIHQQVEIKDRDEFYVPLWKVLNELLPKVNLIEKIINQSITNVINLPAILTEDNYLFEIKNTYKTTDALDVKQVACLMPTLAIASGEIKYFDKIYNLFDLLTLDIVVNHLSQRIDSGSIEKVISVEPSDLRDLYSLFANLDRQSDVPASTYLSLRNLPIWLSSKGLISANHALLPGDFTDPVGVTNLLDVSVLTPSAREFVTTKLEVKTQNIQAFVRNALPRAFNDDGPIDEKKYKLLIVELSNHPMLVNDEECLDLLRSLPIIPTQDGGWAQPPETYRRTDELVKVLGDESCLWVDTSRIPATRSVNIFIDSLGIRKKPSPQHLVDRIISISEKFLPTEECKRASAEAFYALCDNYEEWKGNVSFNKALGELRAAECFPAEGDSEQWYLAEDLYAPYQSKAFNSQANILDFRYTRRLNTDLLHELNIVITPETKLVIDHLMYCVEMNEQPHTLTYQVLNERAQKEDELIAQLARKHCIYVDSLKGFVRPNQLYWTDQKLGNYTYTVPQSLEQFRPFFLAIGVKNAPESKDYVDILLDLIKCHFEQLKPITGVDWLVYETCLFGIDSAYKNEELDDDDLSRLKGAPTVLNLNNYPIYPDEIFLLDSEWLASFFNGELDQALCKIDVNFWSLLEELGVKKLTECAEIKLELFDGKEIKEGQVARKLLDKEDILLRLFHDKSNAQKNKLRRALSQLVVFSYDVVRIQAEVNFGISHILAPPTNASAFYDKHECKLILSRPITDRIWSHILNSLFHQLMPEESGGEISKLTLSFRPLMSMTTEDAHMALTDAGIPAFEKERIHLEEEDLTSPHLENIGGVEESEDDSDYWAEQSMLSQEDPPAMDAYDAQPDEVVSDEGIEPSDLIEMPSEDTQTLSPLSHEIKEAPSGLSSGDTPLTSGQCNAPIEGPTVKKRSKHKAQWDRRLLSYVQKNTGQFREDAGSNEHNLAIEVIARDAVCNYEKKHGRIPEQMPQTHPGYDIISRNSLTNEERFIEVKGISGEWNQTGVGLSRLQFSNAQDYGGNYWLYAVELVSDPENLRVHPICNPASQVAAFMFDGNWRDAVTEDPEDPSLAFIEGARVKHQQYGIGFIVSLTVKGSTRVMVIDFEQGGERTVSLNLRTMEVIEDDYGEDDS